MECRFRGGDLFQFNPVKLPGPVRRISARWHCAKDIVPGSGDIRCHCRVPAGQSRITFPFWDWMVTLAGGLIVTMVVAGMETQPPVAAVTLNRPEALVEALAMEGFWLVEENALGPDQL